MLVQIDEYEDNYAIGFQRIKGHIIVFMDYCHRFVHSLKGELRVPSSKDMDFEP